MCTSIEIVVICISLLLPDLNRVMFENFAHNYGWLLLEKWICTVTQPSKQARGKHFQWETVKALSVAKHSLWREWWDWRFHRAVRSLTWRVTGACGSIRFAVDAGGVRESIKFVGFMPSSRLMYFLILIATYTFLRN